MRKIKVVHLIKATFELTEESYINQENADDQQLAEHVKAVETNMKPEEVFDTYPEAKFVSTEIVVSTSENIPLVRKTYYNV